MLVTTSEAKKSKRRVQKAEYLLQGSDDSDLISCIGIRHTDNTAKDLYE